MFPHSPCRSPHHGTAVGDGTRRCYFMYKFNFITLYPVVLVSKITQSVCIPVDDVEKMRLS